MPPNPITWSGKHEFLIVGTTRHEDTILVRCKDPKQERPLRLCLPTLCITFADMKFANAIAGEQAPYPDSEHYGPAFFDPPVEINGRSEVERLTWIRGAHRVVLGPTETVIEFHAQRELVVPRLRLRTEKPAIARLEVDQALVWKDREFQVDIVQLADGRPLGGNSVRKRHPDYKPPDENEPRPWSLWVKVIDGATDKPLPKAKLRWIRWPQPSPAAPVAVGAPITDENGVIQATGQPPRYKEALQLDTPGWRAVARCFRPLSGQPVRLVMRAWRLKRGVAVVPDGAEIACYRAIYRMEPGDTFEWLAEAFGFAGVPDLAAANEVADLGTLSEIRLPGWVFIVAAPGDTLSGLDERYGLKPGSARTVGRVHHPDRDVPFAGETVALPLQSR